MGPSHRSAGHRPHGAPMRPPHKSVGHRPHGPSMRPSNRPAGHRPHGLSMNPIRTNMNGARPNKSFFIQTPSYETRPFFKSSAVKTQYRAPWVSTVNRNNPHVNRKISTGRRNFPTVNRKFLTASRKFTTGSLKIHTADMGRKGKAGSSQINIDDKGYWDSGCSRHMTGNISYLSDFEPFDRGYVSFGQGGCKITGKGTIKTASKKLDHLIESQRSDQVKEGVGYNAVPPVAADLYLSPKKDLLWTGLPEFVDDTVTDYSRPSPTVVSTSAEGQNKYSSTTEDVASPNILSSL
nr:hypothetical protein [Tanacetum cinerariifolium]